MVTPSSRLLAMATKDVQLELHEVLIDMPEADPSGCTPVRFS